MTIIRRPFGEDALFVCVDLMIRNESTERPSTVAPRISRSKNLVLQTEGQRRRGHDRERQIMPCGGGIQTLQQSRGIDGRSKDRAQACAPFTHVLPIHVAAGLG